MKQIFDITRSALPTLLLFAGFLASGGMSQAEPAATPGRADSTTEAAGGASRDTRSAQRGQGESETAGTDATSGGSTAGVTVEDNLLSTRVKAALLADPEVQDDNIQVQSDHGAITLTGSVENDTQLEQALQVASGVEGVRSVQNNLRVGN